MTLLLKNNNTSTIKPIDVTVDGMITLLIPENSNILDPRIVRPFTKTTSERFGHEENAREIPLTSTPNNTIKIIIIMLLIFMEI